MFSAQLNNIQWKCYSCTSILCVIHCMELVHAACIWVSVMHDQSSIVMYRRTVIRTGRRVFVSHQTHKIQLLYRVVGTGLWRYVMQLLPTALAQEVMQSPPSICFHSIFRTNWLLALTFCMDHYHGSQWLKLMVTGQGQDTVGLTSILDRGQFSK